MERARLGRLDPARSDYLTALQERVVIFDGATGTNLRLHEPGAGGPGGDGLERCNEALALDRPDAVEALHRSFLDVGVEVVETDTFGASSVVLGRYGLGDQVREINVAAARIARRTADGYAGPGSPRWVAGSMGPGTKFPSLGQIAYADLRAAYETQATGLLDGGVDLLLVETVFDLLSAKAAVNGARRAMAVTGRHVPLQVQVTIDRTGRMLPGTEIAAALTTLDAMQVDVIGLNCGTGPTGMDGALRHLSVHSPVPISALPSAGLPSTVEGRAHYPLAPEALAAHLHRFVTDYGVTAIGGCCGTTPEHIRAVVDALDGVAPARRRPVHPPGAASISRPVPSTP